MTFSEENYLKIIYHLGVAGSKAVSTNAIAEAMETKASSVTDMMKKLAAKGLLVYKPYQGASLSDTGAKIAIHIIRKHRLWECFLVDKLNFSWEEVHEVAEQLEHIKSEKLIAELDAFLGFPKKDPHGDPIPDANGVITPIRKTILANCQAGESGVLIGVDDSSAAFLKYLNKLELQLGDPIHIHAVEDFDKSMQIQSGERSIAISHQTATNIYIQRDL